jgi:tRNA1(Val) A37 N6-methylase TrmN6
MNKATTIDGILNNRIRIEQPKKGYRVAVDTVLLAAAVPACAGEKVLDFGSGAGGAMLALACRVPNLRITGIEIQPELISLCRANIERNAMQKRLTIIEINATYLYVDMLGAFDHVMMNPPYHDEARHDTSALKSKSLSNTELDGDFGKWIGNAAQMLKMTGTLTLIHRADRLDDILEDLRASFGTLLIKPVVPRIGARAKRVLIRARKVSTGENNVEPLVLHESDGRYTFETEGILRGAKAIDF